MKDKTERKAYNLLKELWWGYPLSDETYNHIPAELSEDISALLLEQTKEG